MFTQGPCEGGGGGGRGSGKHSMQRDGRVRGPRASAHGSPGVCEVFVFSSCSLCLWFYMSCVRCTTAQTVGETLFLALSVCVCMCVGN